ncbi:MAG TPA: fumarylacetoacetase [Pseudolabrys sp.]
MTTLNETHDPARKSWVETANAATTDFPIQNLPFGVFTARGRDARGGVAIGDMIFDIKAAHQAGLFSAAAAEAAKAAALPALNQFMAMAPTQISNLRRELSDLLRADGPQRARVEKLAGELLVPVKDATMKLPAHIGGFTDFFTSLDHVTRATRVLRPDAPIPPSFKHLPMAYNGRASSVVVSGVPVIRPQGQQGRKDGGSAFAASRMLDYELEVGIYVGAGNELGHPISLRAARDQIFGLCLLNDWSARDIQRFESFPLGPFLGKCFCTSVSPWIVTTEALAPFRVPARLRSADDPPLHDHLSDALDQAEGGFDVTLTAALETPTMRTKGQAPARITRTNLDALYWSCAQMVTHHASNGCNLGSGDLLGTGTLSGPSDESRACMLELTTGGKQALTLPNGEIRNWLEDGDALVLNARCSRDGYASIGFGECRAEVLPALA